MAEPQNSDDELLALLQPPSMTDEFVFESNLPMTADTSDHHDHADAPPPRLAPPPAPTAPMMTLPGPTPMAPMMDSMETESSVAPNGALASSPDLANGQTNGLASSQPVNGSHEIDEDEIAYEPIKTPSRTPRSAKARSSALRSRPKLRTMATPFKSRPKPQERSKSKESETRPEPASQSRPPLHELPKWDFEIAIKPLPSHAAQEYQPIPPGDEIYRVLQKIPTGVPGETWLSVEFEDGRIDQVSQHLSINII